MAIDTAEKRYSIMNGPTSGAGIIMFEVDGAVDDDDRRHLLGLYSGIALASGSVALSGTVAATSGESAQLSLNKFAVSGSVAATSGESAQLSLNKFALSGSCAATSGSSANLTGIAAVVPSTEVYVPRVRLPTQSGRATQTEDLMDFLFPPL